jgi:outer membrane protein TolC
MIIGSGLQLSGQDNGVLTLETAIELALQNNHLLNVRKLQVDEKLQKVNEDRIKYLPIVGIGGSYQYNTSLPSLIIEQGRFGALPLGTISIPLPSRDELITMGKHDIYNAGVTLYQPVTQLGKINSGVNVSRTDLQIAETEKNKTAFQIKQGVEKLYFGMLITQKQIEEAELKVKLAESKLRDVENALIAGKTTESGRYGLAATLADMQQDLLKLKIKYEDYGADLRQLTGFDPTAAFILQPVDSWQVIEKVADIDSSLKEAGVRNNDIIMASLQKKKAEYSIRASKYSYLPDLGLIGGYTYQKGTVIYPENNAYIGASLKWNFQDILSNHAIQKQRFFLREQAEENLANTREQMERDLAKAYRKLKQSEDLINAAGRAVKYRREDLRIKQDRRIAGLNTETELLEAEAAMAKAESDLFSAQMNYRIVLSELKILTGSY